MNCFGSAFLFKSELKSLESCLNRYRTDSTSFGPENRGFAYRVFFKKTFRRTFNLFVLKKRKFILTASFVGKFFLKDEWSGRLYQRLIQLPSIYSF